MGTEFHGFVLFKGGRTYFKREVFGGPEVGKLRVDKESLTEFAKNANALPKVRVTKSGMWVYDESLYKQLLIYAVALNSMRKKNALRVMRLMEVVSKLDEYSLHFWYTEMIARFKQLGLRGLSRVARSLRVLYGVSK
jgi:hypothetical protein